MALGLRNYWDGYFAGRAAPLGRASTELVHAIFYNFADGEVSRHPAPRAPRRRPCRRAGRRGHRRHGGACLARSLRGHPRGELRQGLHVPHAQLAAVVERMRARGLIEASGWLSDAGRETKDRIESLTDDLAAPPYDVLESRELDQLIADLEPIAAKLTAAGSR
jgi:hypothetical protein